MAKTRKSSDITDINALGMYEFHMGEIENDPSYPYPTLRMYGHKGYPDYFVHIRFLETVYIACTPSFDNGFIWRMATKEEATTMHAYADEERAKVYCIEEDLSGYVPPLYSPLQREVRKFFIVAWGLEITLKYDERFEDTVSGWGWPG
jgi:hypothetical protein